MSGRSFQRTHPQICLLASPLIHSIFHWLGGFLHVQRLSYPYILWLVGHSNLSVLTYIRSIFSPGGKVFDGNSHVLVDDGLVKNVKQKLP